jgi:hypothetical protein
MPAYHEKESSMNSPNNVCRKTRRALVALVLLSLWWAPNAARAAANLYWQGGGYMKNYVIDVIFYGNNFTVEDQANVHDYVEYFANYMNGQYSPPGQEPAVHYYGVWGVTPGEMIQDNGPRPPRSTATRQLPKSRPQKPALTLLTRPPTLT